LTQDAALKALLNPKKVQQEIEIIKSERFALIDNLKEISIVNKIYPSDANFLLVEVDDANKRYEELIAKGIVVRNRSNQMHCENCLRFTVGTPEENRELVNALKSL